MHILSENGGMIFGGRGWTQNCETSSPADCHILKKGPCISIHMKDTN